MPPRHNIHKKCTDHTYGKCACCGFIAASPWKKYLREVPFEKQLEIIEMEEGPLGLVLEAPEGTPPYLGALMTNAEVYPPDILVPEDKLTTCIVSVEPSETKQELSSVSVSYEKRHVIRAKKPVVKKSSKKDLRSREKKSRKKAHSSKMCVSVDDFLIPETVSGIKILNKCHCDRYFLSFQHDPECSLCRGYRKAIEEELMERLRERRWGAIEEDEEELMERLRERIRQETEEDEEDDEEERLERLRERRHEAMKLARFRERRRGRRRR